MKRIKKNKKKIIISLLVIVLLLVGGYFVKDFIDKYKASLEEKGVKYYDKIHDLYYFRDGIEYTLDEEGKRVFIEVEDTKFYEISNGKEVFSLVTEEQLPYTSRFLNLKIIDGKYYLKDYGRGLAGYYGTRLELTKYSKNRLTFKAFSKFCKADSRVSYGEGCKMDGYYEIEKPFMLIKEDGKWKIAEYTSVFEFAESSFE